VASEEVKPNIPASVEKTEEKISQVDEEAIYS
jgi:hypothetical protein